MVKKKKCIGQMLFSIHEINPFLVFPFGMLESLQELRKKD